MHAGGHGCAGAGQSQRDRARLAGRNRRERGIRAAVLGRVHRRQRGRLQHQRAAGRGRTPTRPSTFTGVRAARPSLCRPGRRARLAEFHVDRGRGVSRRRQDLYFWTGEQLVAGDTDKADDTYEWSNGVTTLVSAGSGTGCFGQDNVYPHGMSADGNHLYVGTSNRLLPSDTDCNQDLYEYSGGVLSMVHSGPGATGLMGTSADGARIFFTASDSLAPGDTDSQNDIYLRESGNFTLISLGPDGGNGAFSAFQEIGGWVSHDGHRAYFRTFEPLVSSDTDTAIDTYSWHDGARRAREPGTGRWQHRDGGQVHGSVPAGRGAGVPPDPRVARRGRYRRAIRRVRTCGWGDDAPQHRAGRRQRGIRRETCRQNAWSEDGGKVFFNTIEKLVAADTDTAYDAV